MKDNLIIFEEVAPFEELTDREKQAYERGFIDAKDTFTFKDAIGILGILWLGFVISYVLCKYYPELLK